MTKMGLYILGAFVAAAWIFVIYEVITCPIVEDKNVKDYVRTNTKKN